MMVHDGPRLFSMFQYGSRCFEMVLGDQKWLGKVSTAVVLWFNVDLDGLKVQGGPRRSVVHGFFQWFPVGPNWCTQRPRWSTVDPVTGQFGMV